MMSYENKVIHIVGSVDIGSGTGEFLYVNPATAAASQSATAGAAPPANQPPQGTGFELVVEAADGKELSRVRPTILLPSDDHASKTGLIDQNVSYAAGMARLVLLHDGKVVNTFEAGSPEPTVTARSQGLEMGAGPPGHPEKRSMSMAAPDEPGVSYTIQVRPDGEKTWQTIAVGQKSPKVVLDRNQFPAAERATVRVLRSTGFDDSIIAEDEMDLRFKE
ncbi:MULTISPECIES: hypothetical protein [unclassified Bradyrhizobium]|uniref:hypothetical protein n=2 Tax=unclassified Bradyrhizobium TaxID=2631580 RepID=UPI001FFAA952|nr:MULTISPECIES: hypothetical protein [unclassified Bradyrhizobium]MCK1507056.1 hypothetical protein [Bradyrhizobium sp. 18]UPJ81743.1 hypothetical protein IVB17_07160 [Bradyrhizobium sp. 184]UPJ89537.1 hypothetical protein IVB16_07160 [Bradyrhizobium sp. 183]